MSAEDNKGVVRHLHDALNRGDFSVLDQHPGLAEIKPTLERARADLPDSRMTIEEIIAEGEWVALRLIAQGQNSFEVLCFYRIVDGKIVRQHSQAGT